MSTGMKCLQSGYTLEIQRLQQLLILSLGLDIKTIIPSNYDHCMLAVIAKCDSLPSVRQGIHFHTQVDDLEDFSPALERLPKDLSPSVYRQKAFSSDLAVLIPDLEEMARLEDNVGSFLKDKYVYLLVLLHTLTLGVTDTKTQGWNGSIKRLLLKHLRYLCGTNEVENVLDTFSNQFLEFTVHGQIFSQAFSQLSLQ